jgi:hypothetical protein
MGIDRVLRVALLVAALILALELVIYVAIQFSRHGL